MQNFFRSDAQPWAMMGRLADILILNILFIITSIPVITIGASLSALSYTCLKIWDNDAQSYITDYFYAFKQNLKQSTLLYLLHILIGAALSFLAYQILQNGADLLLYVCISVLRLFHIVIVLYSYFISARFENTIGNILLHSFVLSITHFGYSIAILSIAGIPLLCYVLIPQYMPLVFVAYAFVGIGMSFVLMGYFFHKIFAKYLPKVS